MSTRKPAAARSSSDSPPQKPYSRLSRAQSRHCASAGQARQIARARASRMTRVSGRSPAGAKKRSVWPEQAASAVHASGPVKIRLEMVSAAIPCIVPDDRWICPTGTPDIYDRSERWYRGGVEFRHLDTLLAIDEEGSFTAAADTLATVQSNVSEQIRQLEAELGVQLLVRGRKGAATTEFGTVVLDRARRIRRELEAMRADLSMLQGLETGDASFGIVGTASRWVVPKLVAELRVRAPAIRLRVVEAASERLLKIGRASC